MTNTKVFHSHNEFVRGKSHINGIESFWSFTKRRFAKFNGLSHKTFYLHLKESQFRFNNRFKDIYAIMLNNLEISYALKFPRPIIFYIPLIYIFLFCNPLSR